jgi:hypothetical protein
MFKILKNSTPKNAVAADAAQDSVPTQTTQQPTKIKRELIRVVLKDTLRMHGIPYNWLACEIIIIPRGPGAEDLYIQLVMMKWNESLLRYASALQQQLLSGLDRFDPSVDHSKYVVSWRFSPDCGCPFIAMPEPAFWARKATPAAPAVEEAPSILDRRKSRRPKDAPIYSREVSEGHGHGERDDGDYESTKLSPLR